MKSFMNFLDGVRSRTLREWKDISDVFLNIIIRVITNLNLPIFSYEEIKYKAFCKVLIDNKFEYNDKSLAKFYWSERDDSLMLRSKHYTFQITNLYGVLEAVCLKPLPLPKNYKEVKC